MTNQSAPRVVTALYNNWILKFGCPSFILSDQGINVDGTLIHEIHNAFHIEKHRTSAYHSQGKWVRRKKYPQCPRNSADINPLPSKSPKGLERIYS